MISIDGKDIKPPRINARKRAHDRGLLRLESTVRELQAEQAGLRADLQRLIDALVAGMEAKR